MFAALAWLTSVRLAGFSVQARGAHTGGRSVGNVQTGSICPFTHEHPHDAPAEVERPAIMTAASNLATRFMGIPLWLEVRQSLLKQPACRTRKRPKRARGHRFEGQT